MGDSIGVQRSGEHKRFMNHRVAHNRPRGSRFQPSEKTTADENQNRKKKDDSVDQSTSMQPIILYGAVFHILEVSEAVKNIQIDCDEINNLVR